MKNLLSRIRPVEISFYSLVFLAMGSNLAISRAMEEQEKLDFSFIQGGANVDKVAWESINSNYIPGDYLLDVMLNNKNLGKQLLKITPEDKNEICFMPSWLTRAGIYIATDYFKDGYDQARDCYVLSKGAFSQVDFDVATQSLGLILPQQALERRPQKVEWNYGIPAVRINYNGNVVENNVNTTAFGSADLKANINKWIVNSMATAIQGSYNIAMLTATRAIQRLHADLILGKTFVGDPLLGSAGIYGATLSSNNSMLINDLGYAPFFSGIANSQARVTLIQSGNTLYSELVPPGPFVIRDVTLLNSGDVAMIITEQDGSVTRRIFPLTVMAGLITPEANEYAFSVGIRDNSSQGQKRKEGLSSLFWGHGFNRLTLRSGVLLHRQYQGISSTLMTQLGEFGGVSLGGAYARAQYTKDDVLKGKQIQLTWNKTFSATKTSVYASLGRRLSQDYVNFSDFYPQTQSEYFSHDTSERASHNGLFNDKWLCGRRCYQRESISRNEISIGVSQPIHGLLSLGVSGWRRDYWNSPITEMGLTGTLSSQIKQANLSLGFTGNRPHGLQSSYSVSLTLSVPFTLFERRYSAYSTAITNNQGSVGFSSGVSGSLSDRMNYTLGVSGDNEGSLQSSLSGSYTGDRVGLGMSLGQSVHATTGSVTLVGSMLALPTEKSFLLSRTVNDTVAVAKVKDIPGVKFFSGIATTDNNGNVVIPLHSYHYNTVTVDTTTLPAEVELESTSIGVVPTAQSVVLLSFNAWKIQRYLLQVREPGGKFINGGVWARDSHGTPLGFIAQNGLLMINATSHPGSIQLNDCVIPASKIQDSNKLQEVICEK